MAHKKTFLIITAALIVVALSFKNAFTRKNGTYQYTGAPNENTCSNPGCHGAGNGPNIGGSSGGLADNAGPGNITVTSTNLTGWVYVPGVTYHLNITVSQTGRSLFGFNSVILDKNGKSAGKIIAEDFLHTQVGVPGNGNMYITHRSGNGATNTPDAGSFTFDWTAPESYVGDITLYAAGVAANGDDTENSSDNVYSLKQTITPSTPTYTITGTLSAFEAPSGSSSTAQTITLAGTHIGKVSIKAPANFEISTTAASGYSTLVQIPPTNGLISSILYVRMKPFSIGNIEGNFVISTAPLADSFVSVTGTATQPITPAITASDLSSPFIANVGSTSTLAGLSIAGYNLTKSFVITVSAGFEIASVTGGKFTSKLTIPLTPDPFIIWVRFNATKEDSVSGNITIASTGATTVKVPVLGIGSLATLIEFDGAKIKDPNLQVFPNPVSNSAQFSFYAISPRDAHLTILNSEGGEMLKIDKRKILSGINSIDLDISLLPSGTYFIALEWQMSVYKKNFVVIK